MVNFRFNKFLEIARVNKNHETILTSEFSELMTTRLAILALVETIVVLWRRKAIWTLTVISKHLLFPSLEACEGSNFGSIKTV